MKIGELANQLIFRVISYDDFEELEPGDVLKRKDGGFELVGTINQRRGYCDCCSSSWVEYIAIAKDAFGQTLTK